MVAAGTARQDIWIGITDQPVEALAAGHIGDVVHAARQVVDRTRPAATVEVGAGHARLQVDIQIRRKGGEIQRIVARLAVDRAAQAGTVLEGKGIIEGAAGQVLDGAEIQGVTSYIPAEGLCDIPVGRSVETGQGIGGAGTGDGGDIIKGDRLVRTAAFISGEAHQAAQPGQIEVPGRRIRPVVERIFARAAVQNAHQAGVVHEDKGIVARAAVQVEGLVAGDVEGITGISAHQILNAGEVQRVGGAARNILITGAQVEDRAGIVAGQGVIRSSSTEDGINIRKATADRAFGAGETIQAARIGQHEAARAGVGRVIERVVAQATIDRTDQAGPILEDEAVISGSAVQRHGVAAGQGEGIRPAAGAEDLEVIARRIQCVERRAVIHMQIVKQDMQIDRRRAEVDRIDPTAGRLDHCVLAPAVPKQVGIVPAVADQQIVPGVPGQSVGIIVADQQVVPRSADQVLDARDLAGQPAGRVRLAGQGTVAFQQAAQIGAYPAAEGAVIECIRAAAARDRTGVQGPIGKDKAVLPDISDQAFDSRETKHAGRAAGHVLVKA